MMSHFFQLKHGGFWSDVSDVMHHNGSPMSYPVKVVHKLCRRDKKAKL
jgi:hypothetical protein